MMIDSPRLLARDLDADAYDHYDSQSEFPDLDHRLAPLQVPGPIRRAFAFSMDTV